MLVSALKQLIFERSSIPIERQRIIFQGRVLVDDKKIFEYKIDDGHVLHMVAMPERQNQPTQTTQPTNQSQSQPQTTNQQNPMNGIFMNPFGGNISSGDLGSVIFFSFFKTSRCFQVLCKVWVCLLVEILQMVKIFQIHSLSCPIQTFHVQVQQIQQIQVKQTHKTVLLQQTLKIQRILQILCQMQT
jgi:hypothetical protein